MKALKTVFRTSFTDWSLLLMRLGLGGVMFAHGAQKMFGWFGGHDFNATMQAFTAGMHIPVLLAFIAIATEFFGSLALILGVLTRIAAGGIAIMMAVAVALVHVQNGFFMNWQGNQKGEGFEFHILAATLALALLLAGSGKFGIDSIIAQKYEKIPGGQP